MLIEQSEKPDPFAEWKARVAALEAHIAELVGDRAAPSEAPVAETPAEAPAATTETP